MRLRALREFASGRGVMILLEEIGALVILGLIVAVARRHSVSSAPMGANTTATPSASASPVARLVALPFVTVALAAIYGIPAVFVYLGTREAWRDHVKRTTFEPVPAVVLQSTIEARRLSRRGSAWAPLVRYRYSVGGQTYIGHQVTPLDEAYSESWASGLADQFHKGQSITAYVDPARADDAFLVQRTSWLPYLFIAVGVAFPGVLVTLSRRRAAGSV